ncbi:MAG: hypothetical protein BZ138_05910 [Methanosphaera sp. rholeuAM270]|nr:MAG: hypothetical protein BZ138_05910 [Methanosphaera sp. rholeuAM270]
MKDVSINARIPSSLKDRVISECRTKHMSMTAFLIRSLTHELHREQNDLVVNELKELRRIIDEKIDDYTCTTCNTNVLKNNEIKDLKYYLNELKLKQDRHGQVTEGLIENYAKNVGITFEEMLTEINDEGLELNIM